MIPAAGDIYLDNNATTRVLPQAARDAQDAMEELFGNPSSSHITGLRARHLLESTRKLIRAYLGGPAGRIIFTSGATEAIQLAVFSTLCELREQRDAAADTQPSRRVLLYGSTEHKAVPHALEHWNRLLCLNAAVLAIPVDRRGRLDLDFLAEHAAAADMVCTMAVNNETGVIHDLAAIECVLRDRNATSKWLVDCVQAVGKVSLDFSQSTIDYAALSGHKIHAPKGIGVLYVRRGAPLTPLFAGGGQEDGARSGTENLPGVAALGAVFRSLVAGEHAPEKLHVYRDRLAASLQRAFPSIVINTPFDEAVPTTINFSVKGFTSKEILDLFDAAGIRVSSGSACGSALQGSYVLDAMGLPLWRSEGAIRASFGLTTSEAEIHAACQRIEDAGRALRDSSLIVSNDVSVRRGVALDGLIQLKKGSKCSWILIDAPANQCIIVDPFEELADRIESLVRCQQSRVLAVLDTHLHVDHESCRQLLLDVLGDQVAPQAREADALGWPLGVTEIVTLGNGSAGQCFRLGNREIVAQTELPGHTVDGRAFLVGKPDAQGRLLPEQIRFAFTGDTIQIGGLGRTDFPSSAPGAMFHSLHKLAQIVSDSTVLCPTHDYVNGFSTTLAAERRGASLLASVLDPVAPIDVETFLTRQHLLDQQIEDRAGCELICGVIQPPEAAHSSIDLRPEELRDFFSQHPDWLVIDVREPQEFQFAQDWASLGLAETPENIPLSRFSNFLQELLSDRDHHSERDIVFICRSGNRSAKAAELLRRSGFPNVWHIAGGIALGARRREPQPIAADDMEFVI